MSEQMPATQPVAAPAAASAPAPAQARPSNPAKPEVKGDMRAGVGFWSMGTMVAGIASDLAKPVADLAPYLFALFLIGAGACAWLAFFRKPPLQIARTMLGTAAIGAGVFGFFLLAPMLAGSQGSERGVLAAVAPPIAAVQTAVLPLSPVEKELLTLGTRLSTGDPEVRSAAARAALTGTSDKPTRRAMLERVLRNPDANIRQAGIVQALADRGRQALLVLPDGQAAESPLKAFLTGAQVTLTRVDVDTGGFAGVFVAGGSRSMEGAVANGRMIINSQYYRGGWKNGLVMDLSIDRDFRLVGTARTPEDEPVKIEIPLL